VVRAVAPRDTKTREITLDGKHIAVEYKSDKSIRKSIKLFREYYKLLEYKKLMAGGRFLKNKRKNGF